MRWYPTSREKRARCGAPVRYREGSSYREWDSLLVGETAYRQQDQGGCGQVVEQHSLRQRDGGQQDGDDGLPCLLAQSIAGHFIALPWRLVTETEKIGESRPSLFSTISVASIGTSGPGFYNTLG